MTLEVSSRVLESLRAQAAAARPFECCGILLGQDNLITRVLAARNLHPAPKTHFEIDPQALVDAHREARDGGDHVLGYYHSHPTGSTKPSPTDRAMAAHDGKVWAIIAGNDIECWRDGDDEFAALPYRIVDR